MVIGDNGNTIYVTCFQVYAHLCKPKSLSIYYLYTCNVSIGLGRMLLIYYLILDGVAFHIIIGSFV